MLNHQTPKKINCKFSRTYLNLILIKKYIFNNAEIVEITTKIAKEICKDTGESAKIKVKK